VKDLKSYLERGILEQYVLGDLSSEEQFELEKYALLYPEIKTELLQIELALITYAKMNAISPPEKLRNKILNGLEFKDKKVQKLFDRSSKWLQFYKYSLAASLVLLFMSIISVINLNKKLNDSYEQIAILETGIQRFSNQVNSFDQELTDARNALYFYQNQADFKLVTLRGSEKAPEASLLVAFNPKEEEVMIDLSSLKMPSNDKEHQYQLWAMVDGKPVDLGVFDSEVDSTGMKKMKSVKNVQAFAVTLELRGGSANPNMDQMMAIGSI